MDDPTIDQIDEEHGSEFLERVTEAIIEQMYDRSATSSHEEGEDGYVFVSDVQMINATNHVATGVFRAGGTEYSFEVESGDNRGWVWRSVDADAEIPDIKIEHTSWALAPTDHVVDGFIERGTVGQLLQLWDAFLQRPALADLPRKYAYDRMFAPGVVTEKHYRDAASKVGMQLVDKEDADALRARLVRLTEDSPQP